MPRLTLYFFLILSICNPTFANAKRIKFNVPIEAVYFTDSADVDGDGIDDVIVSAQIDAYAQLGIKCCEVPASLISQISGVIPKLYLSNYGKPKYISLPKEAQTLRAWAGAFFHMNDKLYYVHGKNGELGLPSQNKGEKSQIYRVNKNSDNVEFQLVATFPYLRTTASIDVRTVKGGVEIIQNNYNKFGAPTEVYRSHYFLFTHHEKLREITPSFSLKNLIAHNEIKFSEIVDGYALTSTEVWKNNSGTKTITSNPSSYYTNNKRKIDLSPVSYGNNHAGFSTEELFDDERTFILELSTEFFGHQNGGYKGSKVAVYNLDLNSLNLKPCTEYCDVPVVTLPMTTQVYLRRIDLDFDGKDEVYVTGYESKGVHIFYIKEGNLRQINSRRFSLQNASGWYGRVHLLRDTNKKCVYSLSTISNFAKGKSFIDIKTSSCRKRRL